MFDDCQLLPNRRVINHELGRRHGEAGARREGRGVLEYVERDALGVSTLRRVVENEQKQRGIGTNPRCYYTAAIDTDGCGGEGGAVYGLN